MMAMREVDLPVVLLFILANLFYPVVQLFFNKDTEYFSNDSINTYIYNNIITN